GGTVLLALLEYRGTRLLLDAADSAARGARFHRRRPRRRAARRDRRGAPRASVLAGPDRAWQVDRATRLWPARSDALRAAHRRWRRRRHQIEQPPRRLGGLVRVSAARSAIHAQHDVGAD